ncbi:hypothetical protein [Nocardia sp. AB354]|uniref:hypothetical protein n=1 Tax=Nocardia sp. AB354 TaxID=3413283 RepID=UPI003C25C2C9
MHRRLSSPPKPRSPQSSQFHASKVAVASFFANSPLPYVTTELAVAWGTDATVTDLNEAGS